jgi:hypothetical protein
MPAMPYVLRNREGLIDSLHREPEAGASFLPPDHPEVLAFLGREEHLQRFASMDADLVRVLEDLVDVLIVRNVIRITDLPAEAQQKLFDRKHFRDRMQQHALKLFGNDSVATPADEVVPTDFGDTL